MDLLVFVFFMALQALVSFFAAYLGVQCFVLKQEHDATAQLQETLPLVTPVSTQSNASA